jgi:predicted DCC family thiol-disulfide oxidoreductase YuxK
VITAAFTPEGRVRAALRSPTRLLVLYDSECALCRRCRAWLEQEPAYVDVQFLAAGADEAQTALAPLRPWLGAELVVVSERGEVWLGAAAFLMCLWATRQYREWSYRLSDPALAPIAEKFFHMVSSRRATIGRFLGDDCPDGRCKHRR